MRELILIPAESTRSSLVFSAADGDEQFFLAVDDNLRATLLGQEPEPDAVPEQEERAEEPPADSAQAPAEADLADEQDQPEAAEEASAAPIHREPRPQREVDPRLSVPLKMRPREIQDRIRGGASIAEVAEENGVTESRIEPYAHPVLLERARIAEMAKSAHPVRDDGPAKLSLWEVLATAFAARGLDLGTTEWDAYRDPANQWVVKVTWKAGLSENEAEWSYLRHGMSNATAVARNGIAADLIDPDFAQPVRSLSAVGHRGEASGLDALIGDEEEDVAKTRDDIPRVEVDEPEDSAEQHEEKVDEVAGEEFLQHPESKPAAKRRRKAVTPHWEDVLLGVRANTKRPRN